MKINNLHNKVKKVIIMSFLLIASFSMNVAANTDGSESQVLNDEGVVIINSGDEFVDALQNPQGLMDANQAITLKISKDIEVDPKNPNNVKRTTLSTELRTVNIVSETPITIKVINDSMLFSIEDNSNITINVNKNITFSGGGVGSNGFLSAEKSKVTFVGDNNIVEGFTQELNNNVYHSPVSLTESELTIKNMNFLNNTGFGGGVIYGTKTNVNDFENRESSLILNNIVFENNKTVGENSSAGVIVTRDVDVTIEDVTFKNNSSTSFGGVLSVSAERGRSILDIKGNTKFVGNSSTFGGGAIFIATANMYGNSSDNELEVNIDNTEFTNNNSGTFGGAIYSSPASGEIILNISNSTFESNIATKSGGAMLLSGAAPKADRDMIGGTTTTTLRKVNAKGNYGTNGGFIYHSNSNSQSIETTIIESKITSNESKNYGGSIYAQRTNVEVEDSLISLNLSSVGGGLYIDKESTLGVSNNSSIIENTAKMDGGGIYTAKYEDYYNLTDKDYQNLTISEDTIFDKNTAATRSYPPKIVSTYKNIKYASSSLTFRGEYLNPINNYDINNKSSEKEPEVYTVVYDGNGATSGEVPLDVADYLLNETVTVLGKNTIEKEGYTFKGWSVDKNGLGTVYTEGNTFEILGNTTLYAHWEKTPIIAEVYTVIYDGNGSTSGEVPFDSNEYLLNATVTVLGKNTIEREGYTFKGWTVDKNGLEMVYTEGNTFELLGNTTLYAQWEKVNTVTPVEPETPKLPETGVSSNSISSMILIMGVMIIAGNSVLKKKSRKFN